MLVRISINRAKLLHGLNKPVYLLPNKISLNNVWIKPFLISSGDIFDKQVNTYQYYNCNSEVGKTIHYYTEINIDIDIEELSLSEAASLWRLDSSTLRDRVNRRTLPARRVAGNWVVTNIDMLLNYGPMIEMEA